MANPLPDRSTEPDPAPNWSPIQTMYNPDLDCDDSVFHADEDIVQYFNKYRFKVLTDVRFKEAEEALNSKPKMEFLDLPLVNEVIMASKSVRNDTCLPKDSW